MTGKIAKKINSTPAVTCLKILLTILNIFFFLTGIAIFTLGVWVKVQLHLYMEMTSVHYNNNTAPWVLILVGLGIMLITLLGCCCTIKGTSCLLYIYGLLLGLIFLADFAVAISSFVFKGKVEEGFRIGLVHYMQAYATDEDKRNAVNDLQQTLNCCGNNSYTDWYNIAWNGLNSSQTVPPSCYGDERDKNGTLYEEGCFKKVAGFMESNFLMIGGIAIGFSFVQLFGAMLACCLGKNINRSKYEQVA